MHNYLMNVYGVVIPAHSKTVCKSVEFIDLTRLALSLRDLYVRCD